jgi:ABC-2 type transport system permease protein
MRSSAKYVEIFKIAARSAFAYPLDTFARVGFMGMVIFVFAQLWIVTFDLSGRSTVGGYDRRQMVWYLVLTETVIMSCPRVFSQIDQEVRSGDLAYILNRPYNYALYHLATYAGTAVLLMPANFAVGSAIAWLLVGEPLVDPITWPAISVAVILAIGLNFAIELSIGLLAFWFEDTSAFFWIFQKVVFTLGGLFLPLEAFPDTLRQISVLLPFTSIAYAPARLTASFSTSAFLTTIGTQAFWLVVMGIGCVVMFRAGVRRLNVNGG